MSEETLRHEEHICKTLSDWMDKKPRPPANQLCTAGPLRDLAYKIEEQGIFGGWQTMESAPKNGTSILCYNQEIQETLVLYFDAYAADNWPWCTLDGPCYHKNWPTAWAVLPKPPAPKEQK